LLLASLLRSPASSASSHVISGVMAVQKLRAAAAAVRQKEIDSSTNQSNNVAVASSR